MKKKIFGAVVVVAIAVGAMINVNLNKTSNKGDLAMANVEALASCEATIKYDGGIIIVTVCNRRTPFFSVASCSESSDTACSFSNVSTV